MFSTRSELCPCACSTRTCKHMASAHVRKRISTEEAAAGTRKGRRKGGAHRARERAQMPEMRENRTGTHHVSFRARAQQSTMHATRRSANLGFEAGRRGGKEDGSCEEPQPSRRRQAEHSHAHALAACGARGGGCRGEGGDRAREHTPFFRGDGADTSWSSNRCGRPRSREDHCGASALLPRSRDCDVLGISD